MARKRMIDPSFWIDEKLGTCTRDERLLFMGLISNADDEGRLQGHPSLIKSMCFPYDEISIKTVEKWIDTLKQKKLILLYTSGSQQFIQVLNFSKYQTINRPTPSKLPVPLLTDNSLNTHGEERDDSLLKEVKGIEDNINIPYVEIINYLNQKAGTQYRANGQATKDKIIARWNDKFTLDDFKRVIDNKVADWKGTEQEKYLRPETLFGNKFESYLNQKPQKKLDTEERIWR